MNVKKCDQCKSVIPRNLGFYLRNEHNMAQAGISSEPNTVDLCSWRCVEDYARKRAT